MCTDRRPSHGRHLFLEIVSTHGLAVFETVWLPGIQTTPKQEATPKIVELASSFVLRRLAQNGRSKLGQRPELYGHNQKLPSLILAKKYLRDNLTVMPQSKARMPKHR